MPLRIFFPGVAGIESAHRSVQGALLPLDCPRGRKLEPLGVVPVVLSRYGSTAACKPSCAVARPVVVTNRRGIFYVPPKVVPGLRRCKTGHVFALLRAGFLTLDNMPGAARMCRIYAQTAVQRR